MVRQRHRPCHFLLALLVLLVAVSPCLAEYQVIEVPDGGTIKGQAVWKGEIPKVPPLKVFADLDTCGPQVPSPALRIDPATSGIQQVLVYLERVGPERQFLRPCHAIIRRLWDRDRPAGRTLRRLRLGSDIGQSHLSHLPSRRRQRAAVQSIGGETRRAAVEDRLRKLKQLHEQGLITDDEYRERKRLILDDL